MHVINLLEKPMYWKEVINMGETTPKVLDFLPAPIGEINAPYSPTESTGRSSPPLISNRESLDDKQKKARAAPVPSASAKPNEPKTGITPKEMNNLEESFVTSASLESDHGCKVINFEDAQRRHEVDRILEQINDLLWTDPEAYLQLRDRYALVPNALDERVSKKLTDLGIVKKNRFSDGFLLTKFVKDALYIHVTGEEPFWWWK